jgi:succinate dehydrogenase/fumarate reductase-like Fe-S protein
MNTKSLTLHVYRFDPSQGAEPSYQAFEVPLSGPISVLMALEYVYKHLDATLAFRRYCCGTSRCQSCLMRANGKKIMACSTLAEEGRTLVVEPADGYKIIKDLVVDFDQKIGPAGDEEDED